MTLFLSMTCTGKCATIIVNCEQAGFKATLRENSVTKPCANPKSVRIASAHVLLLQQ